MFKLTSMANAIPKFLYITDVEIEADLDVISTGGFGRVYTAKYKGKQVALKVMDKSRHDVSTLPFFLINIVNADPLRQGIVKERLPAGSHSMAIPLTSFYPPFLGNI